MNWLDLVAYLFGGAFVTNAIPDVVAGMMGEPFQTPFAKPPGQGPSPSIVNILWGFFNILLGYLLVCRVGKFGLRNAGDVAALGLGGPLIRLLLARRFGWVHGGNDERDEHVSEFWIVALWLVRAARRCAPSRSRCSMRRGASYIVAASTNWKAR